MSNPYTDLIEQKCYRIIWKIVDTYNPVSFFSEPYYGTFAGWSAANTWALKQCVMQEKRSSNTEKWSVYEIIEMPESYCK